MVVEDDVDIRKIIGLILHEEDYGVKLCEYVRSIKNQIDQGLPDLLILDLTLSDGNGLDLCSEVKGDSVTSGIPVFLMSSHARPAEVYNKCMPEGLIAKPFDIDDLLTRVGKVVN